MSENLGWHLVFRPRCDPRKKINGVIREILSTRIAKTSPGRAQGDPRSHPGGGIAPGPCSEDHSNWYLCMCHNAHGPLGLRAGAGEASEPIVTPGS